MPVDLVGGAGRRLFVPHAVDDVVEADRVTPGGEELGQDDPLANRTKIDLRAVPPGAKTAEDLELAVGPRRVREPAVGRTHD
ncbi:hypothetical protein [Micromonospora sp. NBC_01796]|uniref:hypothetical protein n=1 Tax=Micromonospora sp. NBC_01796 TaxID=2975987 RepID=UPI002DDBE5F9|nr:hypothetical protein [Micromonospora sp. NBC_01796]WSA90089.1 hypothetical protein OIE47_26920 [Micromonospora sp. NBC_01796]